MTGAKRCFRCRERSSDEGGVGVAVRQNKSHEFEATVEQRSEWGWEGSSNAMWEKVGFQLMKCREGRLGKTGQTWWWNRVENAIREETADRSGEHRHFITV